MSRYRTSARLSAVAVESGVASTLGEVCLEALRAPAGTTLALRPLDPAALATRAPKLLTSGETLDFRTLVPQPGGLFDYKVFGPGTVIDAPALALDAPARLPKTRFARLALAAPLVHPLALVHAPARVAALAGWPADDVRAVWAGGSRLDELAAAVDPALVLRELPVLPPDLRPLLRLDDDRWRISPINELYRHVVRRNHRLGKAIEGGGPAELVAAELHGLADAVLHLFENEDCAEPLHDVHGDLLVSLRGLAGGALFETLADPAHADPPTGGWYRATSVLGALGFEPDDRA